MTSASGRRKRSTVTLPVRLTREEREALRECLFAEGISSMSSWFRQQAIRKIHQQPPTAAEGAGVS